MYRLEDRDEWRCVMQGDLLCSPGSPVPAWQWRGNCFRPGQLLKHRGSHIGEALRERFQVVVRPTPSIYIAMQGLWSATNIVSYIIILQFTPYNLAQRQTPLHDMDWQEGVYLQSEQLVGKSGIPQLTVSSKHVAATEVRLQILVDHVHACVQPLDNPHCTGCLAHADLTHLEGQIGTLAEASLHRGVHNRHLGKTRVKLADILCTMLGGEGSQAGNSEPANTYHMDGERWFNLPGQKVFPYYMLEE